VRKSHFDRKTYYEGTSLITLNNPAGSVWSKWDLHVHTPDSIVHNYAGAKEEAWERFFRDLESLPPEFKVIGINDYVFIDGYERVRKAKSDGRLKNIDLILPVVEFRLDKFAGTSRKTADGVQTDWNRINVHVIFASLEPELIRQQFLSALFASYQLVPDKAHLKSKWNAVITRSSVAELGQMIIDAAPAKERGSYGSPLQEGFNNLCVGFDKIQQALGNHNFEGRALIAIGKTEWDNLKWNDQSIAEKRNIINQADIVFTAAENPDAYGKARSKLIEANVNAKLFDCSDAHDFSDAQVKDRIGNAFTWIKADPTFDGLRHAITEFEQRVYVGEEPPKRKLVTNNRTKYVRAIEIRKRGDAVLSQIWFDVEIPLNHDLVAIIGNKGSGKSALADIAALVGKTRNFSKFSFLSAQRFRDGKGKLARHFEGTLHWEDGSPTSRSLHDDPPPECVERIKYLPQRYLEDLCNELAIGGGSSFDAELRSIIFTHVPEEDRLEFDSLDEILEYKGAEFQSERQRVQRQLGRINADIAAVERRMTPAFRSGLQEQLGVRKNQLSALDKAKPPEVEDPTQSEAARAEAQAAAKQLAEHEGVLKALADAEGKATQARAHALRSGAQVAKALQLIGNHRREHEQFLSDLGKMLSEISSTVRPSDIVSLKIDTRPLADMAAEFQAEATRQQAIITDASPHGITVRREQTKQAIEAVKAKLGDKQRQFVAYKELLAAWEAQRAELVGDANKHNTIMGLERELKELDQLPATRDRLRQQRIAAVRDIHQQLSQLVGAYQTMYKPVQAFVDAASTMDMPLPLQVNVLIAEDGFQDGFLNRMSRQAKGSFYGRDESVGVVQGLLEEANFSDADSVVAFVEAIEDRLHFDRRTVGEVPETFVIDAQLRKGFTTEEIYDYVFGLSYLEPKYSLTYNGQEIGQLSPGERGLLLLVFYLLVDKDDIPLVIDQPEENLDNQTIYKVLVQCIKLAKRRRQVIMVTHNPNLAVVCDAEQIIYAKKSEDGFRYVTGAIESPVIKQHVIEILEGTQPAFDNRRLKYAFHKQ